MFQMFIPNRIEDNKLYNYVQDLFVSIIECEAKEYLDTWNNTSPLEEYLDCIFPRSFIHRNPKKALQIIYDLDDIARSDILREKLPPLHTYAMYQMIRNYENFKNEIGRDEYDFEIEEYINNSYEGDEANHYLLLFSQPSEFFVEQYDDEYIWIDLWEYRFNWYINHPEELIDSTPDMEEMIELMPNDIIYHWNKLKDSNKFVNPMFDAISDFKILVECDLYPAFHVTQNPKEETGRSLLQAFLKPRGFREAQMSGGNSDLIYPAENTIIETKIWRDQERYQDGIIELSSYLDSQGFNIGYYIIFDNTQKNNVIIKSKGVDVFDIFEKDHLIHCIFIKINPVAPSKRRKESE